MNANENIAPISENVKLLSRQIEHEIQRISRETQTENNKTDSLIYIGNWQDAIPRSIWTDPSLGAIEVRSWGVIRTQAISGSAVMLSLNNLLRETLGYSKATISRVIYILRLTRWISLCSTLRTETGQFKGNIYAIHDKPVPLNDAIYLDGNYLSFVKRQLTHNNKTIQKLAQGILAELNQLPDAPQIEQYTSTAHLLDELTNPSQKTQSTQVQILNLGHSGHFSQVQKMNLDQKIDKVQILNLGENNENEENQTLNIQVQKMNLAPICSSSSYINKTTTTLSEESLKIKPEIQNPKSGHHNENDFSTEDVKHDEIIEFTPTPAPQQFPDQEPDLIYPAAFNDNERQLADIYLSRIEPELKQNFLDETAAQIKQRSKTSNPIRNPIGYLSWLCNQHQHGNTYLTSAYLSLQKQRKQQAMTEQRLKQQQDEITRMAKVERPLPKQQVKATNPPRDKTKSLDKVAQLKSALRRTGRD